VTLACKEKERCELPNSISGFHSCWSCFGCLQRVLVKCAEVSKQHMANIFRVTDTFSSSVSLNDPFEPIHSLCSMFLRNDGTFDHCTVQKPVRHVIICHCSAAQQSAAMNLHKAAPTPLTNGSYASPHPLCFVLCFPRQTYLSFVLRCEPSPPFSSAARRCKQSAFLDARNFLAFSMSLVYRHLCGCVGPHQLRGPVFHI
jgi:hypothetical protein